MVSNGSWKDYSFSSGMREVSFDVYQRASDKPVLRILKNLKPNYYNEKYLIKDRNGNILKKSVFKPTCAKLNKTSSFIHVIGSVFGVADYLISYTHTWTHVGGCTVEIYRSTMDLDDYLWTFTF